MVTLDVLRQPGFTLLWFACGIYHSGYFVRGTIQGWLALQLTNSSAWVGLVNGLPVVVTAPLSLLAGGLLDRSDARQWLIRARVVTALLCFLTAYLIAAEIIDPLQLLALSAALNAAYYLAFPANQAYLLAMVGPERLLTANTMVNGLGFGLNVIAPSLAGYVAARIGIDSVYAALALAHLVAVLALARTRAPADGETRPPAGTFGGLLAAVVGVASRPGLAWVLYLAVLSVSGAPFQAVLPAMARDGLGLDAAGFGLIAGSQGASSLVATFVLLAYGQIRRKGLAMLSGGLLWAAGMILVGSSQELWQAMLAAAVMGLAPPLWVNSVQTLMMTAVPPPLRARVATLFTLAFQMTPAGYLLGGFLADSIGPAPTLQLLGSIGALAHLPPLLSRRFRRIG
jgi:MFS family permease